MLAPNAARSIVRLPKLLTAGGAREGAAKRIGHDGVAVDIKPRTVLPGLPAGGQNRWLCRRLFRCLVAAALAAATASVALAQTSQPPIGRRAVARRWPSHARRPARRLRPGRCRRCRLRVASPLAPAPAEKHGFSTALAIGGINPFADFKSQNERAANPDRAFNKQSADAAKDAATATGQAMKNAADAMTHFSHVIEVRRLARSPAMARRIVPPRRPMSARQRL